MKAEKFSSKLRIWRAGRTQRQAAETLGMNLATYRNWEYGRHEPVSWAKDMVVFKMCSSVDNSKDES